MSMGARWTIGIAAVVCAAFCAWLPSQGLSTLWAYCLSAFLIVVAVLCFAPWTAPITARLLGAVLFVGCIAYLVSAFRSPPDPDGVSTPWHAVKAMVFFGLPGGYLMLFGNYPVWGRFARALGDSRGPV